MISAAKRLAKPPPNPDSMRLQRFMQSNEAVQNPAKQAEKEMATACAPDLVEIDAPALAKAIEMAEGQLWKFSQLARPIEHAKRRLDAARDAQAAQRDLTHAMMPAIRIHRARPRTKRRTSTQPLHTQRLQSHASVAMPMV